MPSMLARPRTVVVAIIVSLLVVPTVVGAIALGLGLVPLPYELVLVRQRLPVIFPLHMVAAGLTLILIPIAAAARRMPAVHRIAGRAAAVAIVVGGLAALPVALASEATAMTRAGFTAQAVTWLALLGAAILAIRRRDVKRHRRLMMGVAAVASGAIWLRLVLVATLAAELPFETVYAVAAWACWIVPLAATALADVAVDRTTRPGRREFVPAAV